MMNFLLLLFLSFTSFAEMQFPSPFFFGLATAPGHVEDKLNDIWMDWGNEGKIAAFKNQIRPEERLRFWTNPEAELDLAQKTGIQIYRLGVDWGRIMPSPHVFNQDAIKRYHEIFGMIKDRKMKIMLTIMHHSVPKWIQKKGGWLNPEIRNHFLEFSQKMIDEFQADVTYWITFNEGNVFAPLAYSAGLWPPGEKHSFLSMMALGPLRGETIKAMDCMSETHNELYKWAHQKYPMIKLGLAHNMAYYTGKNFWNRLVASMVGNTMNWRMPEKVRGYQDFFGFNYYGAEWIKGGQIDIDPEEEYSEAGRAVYPQGLYLILKDIHRRFSDLPIIITENGIADETDILRPAYLVEHLRAIAKAKDEGVPVVGYIFWTLSDNMEWADGYCPKFGLVKVNREKNLQRLPRESYFLFQRIVSNRFIDEKIRIDAFKKLEVSAGKMRPFCRSSDGITPLDTSRERAFVHPLWKWP